MRGENITKVSTFILLGFPTAPELQYLLFLLFLLAYLFVLVENLTIILTVWSSASLHRPMYYFLGSLSFHICICQGFDPILSKILEGSKKGGGI